MLSFLGFSASFQERLLFLAIFMKNEADPLGIKNQSHNYILKFKIVYDEKLVMFFL